ncbi:unnamed protein product [Spodoptera exigua]|nr:unnamed protein product [Spodoptera exigua]
MNFAPFTGHIPTAAAIPTIHQFAAKFGYENSGSSSGGVLQETRYQATGSGGGAVQFAVAPGTGTVAVDGVKFRQAESVVVVSSAQPGTVALAGLAPIHTVNTGVKYQTISASSSVNLGNIAYGGQASYVQAETVHQQLKAEQRPEKREYREELHHDIMATMMQQHQGINDSYDVCVYLSPVAQATPLQQGTQQLLVVLHEPKEAAALARAIKQEGRNDRAAATAPTEFISIGDVTDSSTWQTLGGGVADYLSALPLPLHHLLKYSTPANVVESKREEQPTIVTTVNANALNAMPTITAMPANAVNSVVVQTSTIVNQTVNQNTNTVVISKKKKKKKSMKEKKPRPKPGEIRLTTALGFYRKDHLRKHTRSHIARRVKAELSQQGSSSPPLSHAVPAPAPDPS